MSNEDEQAILEFQESVKQADMMWYLMDTRNPIEERIARLKYDHALERDSTLHELVQRAGLTHCATYIRIASEIQAEKYEAARYYQAFGVAYRKLYREAVRSYSQWTIPEFNALEDVDRRLQAKFFGA